MSDYDDDSFEDSDGGTSKGSGLLAGVGGGSSRPSRPTGSSRGGRPSSRSRSPKSSSVLEDVGSAPSRPSGSSRGGRPTSRSRSPKSSSVLEDVGSAPSRPSGSSTSGQPSSRSRSPKSSSVLGDVGAADKGKSSSMLAGIGDAAGKPGGKTVLSDIGVGRRSPTRVASPKKSTLADVGDSTTKPGSRSVLDDVGGGQRGTDGSDDILERVGSSGNVRRSSGRDVLSTIGAGEGKRRDSEEYPLSEGKSGPPSTLGRPGVQLTTGGAITIMVPLSAHFLNSNPLAAAISAGDVFAFQDLLRRADMGMIDELDTANRSLLHYAAATGNATVLKELLALPLGPLAEDLRVATQELRQLALHHTGRSVGMTPEVLTFHRDPDVWSQPDPGWGKPSHHNAHWVDIELDRLERLYHLHREEALLHQLSSADDSGRTVLHYAAGSRSSALDVILDDANHGGNFMALGASRGALFPEHCLICLNCASLAEPLEGHPTVTTGSLLLESVGAGDGTTADPSSCLPCRLTRVPVASLPRRRVDLINAADHDGFTALHIAAAAGDVRAAQSLLRSGAKQSASPVGDTPLSLAPNAVMRRLLVPMSRAVHDACDADDTESDGGSDNGDGAGALHFLLDAGADVDAKLGTLLRTALHVAAAEGRPAVVHSLLDAGADVSATDVNGWTPLHCAAEGTSAAHCKVVNTLVVAGANLSAATNQRRSALHVAAAQPPMDSTAARRPPSPRRIRSRRSSLGLLSLPASEFEGYAPAMTPAGGPSAAILGPSTHLSAIAQAASAAPVSLRRSQASFGIRTLTDTWIGGTTEPGHRLGADRPSALETATSKASVLETVGAGTPGGSRAPPRLHRTPAVRPSSILSDVGASQTRGRRQRKASHRGNRIPGNMVELLVQHGVGAELREEGGHTALLVAARKGRLATVQKLLDMNVDVYAQNSTGRSALHLAAAGGHARVVHLLACFDCETGHLKAMKDKNGKTAADLCRDGATRSALDTLWELAAAGRLDAVQTAIRRGAVAPGSSSAVQWETLTSTTRFMHRNVLHAVVTGASREVWRAAQANKRRPRGRSTRTPSSVAGSRFGGPAPSGKPRNSDATGIGVELTRHLRLGDDVGEPAVDIQVQYGRLASLLLGQGVSVDDGDRDGVSALMLAARYGLTKLMALFIQRGCKVDGVDNDGNSAAHYALAFNQAQAASVLEMEGARMNLLNDAEKSPEDVAGMGYDLLSTSTEDVLRAGRKARPR